MTDADSWIAEAALKALAVETGYWDALSAEELLSLQPADFERYMRDGPFKPYLGDRTRRPA